VTLLCFALFYSDFSAADELKGHIPGMRQFAKRYPYKDPNRVGIAGMDGCLNIVFTNIKYSHSYIAAIVR